jgi:hypothetical protein
MPIQYFDPKATVPAYYPAGHHSLKPGNSAYGPISAVSYGEPTGHEKAFTGPNLAPYPNSTKTQTGGSSPYNNIINPATGRKVSLFSKKGRDILGNYLKLISKN